MATSVKDVENILVKGVIELIGKSVGQLDKLVNIIKRHVKKLKPKFSLSNEGFQLELVASSEMSPAEGVAEALLLLEKLLATKQQAAILLCDEFQEIGQLAQGRGVEGAIRHVAQETQHLAMIFSGSSPHLLKSMFEDERRPLYKLCRKIRLGRIGARHYQQHLNKAARSKWAKPLTQAVFQRIMALTGRHPYYVNYLCDELWSSCNQLPSLQTVEQAWMQVAEEEKSDLLKDFFTLSENQRKLMICLANQGGAHIYANASAKAMDMPASSISRALSALLEKDYLEKIGKAYSLVVPVYATLLHKG